MPSLASAGVSVVAVCGFEPLPGGRDPPLLVGLIIKVSEGGLGFGLLTLSEAASRLPVVLTSARIPSRGSCTLVRLPLPRTADGLPMMIASVSCPPPSREGRPSGEGGWEVRC